MAKRKTEEKAVVIETLETRVSDNTLKKLVEQYKKDNHKLLEEVKKLQDRIAWHQREIEKLRNTNQELIRQRR